MPFSCLFQCLLKMHYILVLFIIVNISASSLRILEQTVVG